MRPLPRHELFHADGRRLLVYGALSGALRGDEPAPEAPQAIHKRVDAFTGDWVGIAPARNTRPLDTAAAIDGRCPFCPGGTEVPFPYEAAVFDNRFPSFRPDPPPPPELDGPTGPAGGRCEVVLYTHRHDASFGDLSPPELARVVAPDGTLVFSYSRGAETPIYVAPEALRVQGKVVAVIRQL